MEVQIKESNELKLVGFRVMCEGDQFITEIPKASLRLNDRVDEIQHVINPDVQMGAFVVEPENAEADGYWVCVEVEEFEKIPADMVALTVPAQKYAVVRHRGINSKIMDLYDDLHKWIENENYKRLKNRWHIEKYYSWTDIENVDIELWDTIE